ncbi:hypothetical protein HN011_008638 [Eciton burchellii]|nr:hypothetical protein HN011_008638 [Eciton burchellii]
MFFIKDTRKIQRLYTTALLLRRSFNINRPVYLQCNKPFQKFKLKQTKMQCDDERPIYLKKGLSDKIIFILMIVYVLYNTYNSINIFKNLMEV